MARAIVRVAVVAVAVEKVAVETHLSRGANPNRINPDNRDRINPPKRAHPVMGRNRTDRPRKSVAVVAVAGAVVAEEARIRLPPLRQKQAVSKL